MLYPRPNEQLRDLLSAAREAGLSFDVAWDQAVRPGLPLVMTTSRNAPEGAIRWPTDRTDRLAWQAAILESRSGWRRAYLRRPSTAPERAVATLADALRELDAPSIPRTSSEGIRHRERVRSAA